MNIESSEKNLWLPGRFDQYALICSMRMPELWCWRGSVEDPDNKRSITNNILLLSGYLQVGFDAGDSRNKETYFDEDAVADQVISLPCSSNIEPNDLPGFFIYKVSDPQVSFPKCGKSFSFFRVALFIQPASRLLARSVGQFVVTHVSKTCFF